MDIDKNKRIGLTDEQVKQSREQHGKNVLTPSQRTSLWKLYLDKYRDPIIQILLVAAFVSLILAFIEKNFMETIGIFVAVFLATTVGFYFERDAAKKFNLLMALSEEQPVKVRRNGKVMEIPRHDVVVWYSWKWATRCLPMANSSSATTCRLMNLPLRANRLPRNLWKAVAMEPILATSSSVLPW